MFYLNKNSSNDVVLTLDESAVSGISYMIRFVNDQDLDDITNAYFEDIAPSGQTRYNEFNIIHSTTISNPSGGTVNLNEGDYTYYAYDMSVLGSVDPDDIIKLVEYGKCRVIYTETDYSYTDSNEDYVYTG